MKTLREYLEARFLLLLHLISGEVDAGTRIDVVTDDDYRPLP